jgi:hypothetical protein
MWGAEWPAKVQWHQPFLPPLEPLSSYASRQIFLDIMDDPDSGEESALNDLLDLSGSLPLAVSLMANIALFEGYAGTLHRWQIENTTLLGIKPKTPQEVYLDGKLLQQDLKLQYVGIWHDLSSKDMYAKHHCIYLEEAERMANACLAVNRMVGALSVCDA